MTFVGTAAWSIGREVSERFPLEGSSLSRYAALLDGVEVNSSFYRTHKPATWRRWADSVPDGFRFSVKLPKCISHDLQLVGAETVFDDFLAEVTLLGEKLGPLLLQLPPSLAFDADAVDAFLSHVRRFYPGRLVVEPRHPSWTAEASDLLSKHAATRVFADPAPIPNHSTDSGFCYLRLHGAPKIYYSAYGPQALAQFAAMLKTCSRDSWCIFDNTASGAALGHALTLAESVRPS